MTILQSRISSIFRMPIADVHDYIAQSNHVWPHSQHDDAFVRIRHNVAFSTMQQANPDHVKKGQSYDWVETLSPDQKQRALHIAEPMLAYLGYPLKDSDTEHLPKIPPGVNEKHIRQLVADATRSPMNLKTVVSRLRLWR